MIYLFFGYQIGIFFIQSISIYYNINQNWRTAYILNMRNWQNPKDAAKELISDLSLIDQIRRRQDIGNRVPLKILNLKQMGQYLALKNAKFNYSFQQRQRAQGRIRCSHIDFQALYSRVEKAKREINQKYQQEKKPGKNYFYIGPAKLYNQSESIIKNVQYFTFNLLTETFSVGMDQVYSKILKKPWRNQNQNLNGGFTEIRHQAKNRQKEIQYSQIVDVLVKKGQREEKQWVYSLKSASKAKIWDILYALLADNPSGEIWRMAISALKIVQSEFNSMIPSNHESLAFYLSSNYLKKFGQSVKFSWGIPYLLYKSGRKDQFYDLLPDNTLLKQFKKVDGYIQRKQTSKGRVKHKNKEIEDPFYEQLQFALNGQAKYSSQFLCDRDSLDIAWVFLRNVGIFPDRQQKFMELRSEIYHSYKQQHITDIKILNLIYLLHFDALVQLGPNQILDDTDYLHFLILLFKSFSFKKLVNINSLKKRLAQRLLQTIGSLIEHNQDEYLSYISLMPEEVLASEVSGLITDLNRIERINWKELSKIIPKCIYLDLVVQTCSKHAEKHHEYVVAAEKNYEILQSQEESLRFLGRMFIKWKMGSYFEGSELEKGRSFARQLLTKNERAAHQFKYIFQFFEQWRGLQDLLSDRNEKKIEIYLSKCQYILISAQLRTNTESLLQTLIEENGFDCFIYYMIDVLRAYDICLLKLNKSYQFQEILRITLNAVIQFLKQQPYSKFSTKQSVMSLIRILEDSLFRSI